MKPHKIHTWRRAVQLLVAVFFILAPVLNERGFKFVWGNFLNMHLGSLTFSDPLAVLQAIVNNRYLPAGLLIGAGLVLATAFFLGTIFCSWICPFGLLSELINGLARRFRRSNHTRTRILQNGFWIKLIIFGLGFMAVWAIAGSPLLNRLSLPFHYTNIFQYLFVQQYLSSAIVFLGVVLLLELAFQARLWCRFICPQSVLISLFKMINPFRLKTGFDPGKCVTDKVASPCRKACSLDLDPRCLGMADQLQCNNCGDCVDACRKTSNALRLQIFKR